MIESTLYLLHFTKENFYMIDHSSTAIQRKLVGYPDFTVVMQWEVTKTRAMFLEELVSFEYHNFKPGNKVFKRNNRPSYKFRRGYQGGATACFRTSNIEAVIKFIEDRLTNDDLVEFNISLTDLGYEASIGPAVSSPIFTRKLPFYKAVDLKNFLGDISETDDILNEVHRAIVFIKN